MDFKELAERIHQEKGLSHYEDTSSLLAFDPGHTTGWAMFDYYRLWEAGQLDTDSIEKATHAIGALFDEMQPRVVVMEDYRVYKWRAQHHIGSEMLTTRVIGCIETIAVQRFIGMIAKQPANVAKGFCTDAKLREWGFYKEGEKHARDAIRHGAYYILFGPIRKTDKAQVTVG